MSKDKSNIISTNRKARHDYEIVSSIETGIVLTGTEVKSLRDGKANLADSYAKFVNGELWVINLHISPYTKSAMENHDPLRDRKLLLHKLELKKLMRQVDEKGVTLIPLKLYFKNHLVKLELALARGKRKYDKRAAIAERDMKRDMDRHNKNRF
ncbi:MAG: SsrA-binding protein SmpB [Calditrichaceae bacterium]